MGDICSVGDTVVDIARGSYRSLAKVGIFFLFGLGFASFRYHEDFFFNGEAWKQQTVDGSNYVLLGVYGTFFLGYSYYVIKYATSTFGDYLVTFAIGAIFGLGLMISGMLRPSKILGFITIQEKWDPTLAFTMLVTLLINVLTFNLHNTQTLINNQEINHPDTTALPTLSTIIGAAIFGIGWGMGGLCPVSATAVMFTVSHGFVWILSFFFGKFFFEFLHYYRAWKVSDEDYSRV